MKCTSLSLSVSGGIGAGKASLCGELAVQLLCPMFALDARHASANGSRAVSCERLGQVFRGAFESGCWLLLRGLAQATPLVLLALSHHLSDLEHRAFHRHALSPREDASSLLDLQKQQQPGRSQDGTAVLALLDRSPSTGCSLPAALLERMRPTNVSNRRERF